MLEWYLNAKVQGSGILSKVGGVVVKITTDDMRKAYELPPTTETKVRSHTFNENEFWKL